MAPPRNALAMIRARRALGLAMRKPRKRVPAPIHPDRIADFYYSKIHQYLEVARAMVNARALPLVRRDSALNDELDKLGSEFFQRIMRPADLEAMLAQVAGRTDEWSRKELGKMLEAQLGVDPLRFDPGLAKKAADFTVENVALIKSIPSKYFDEVEKVLTRAITDGTRHEEIAKELEGRFGVAESSAKLVARDQVGKYFGAVQAERQKSLGIEKFIWRTVNDARVRPEHAELNGRTFSWDAPPAAEGIPGQAINCRCYAEPIIDELAAEAP